MCLGSTEGGKRKLGTWSDALRGTSFDLVPSRTSFFGIVGDDVFVFFFLGVTFSPSGVSSRLDGPATEEGGGVVASLAFFLEGLGASPFSWVGAAMGGLTRSRVDRRQTYRRFLCLSLCPLSPLSSVRRWVG